MLFITFYFLSFFTESAPTRSPTSQTRTTRSALNEHSRVCPGTTLCHPNSPRTLMISSQALSRAQSPPSTYSVNSKKNTDRGHSLKANKNKHYLHKYCIRSVHPDQLFLQQNKQQKILGAGSLQVGHDPFGDLQDSSVVGLPIHLRAVSRNTIPHRIQICLQ